ncbi:MAG: SAM-dependent methyltransferase [Betaproteobacteria bacterium]|nr:SAM-dependent methyltransferase [Betaproteobacteria bacterium]
MSGTSSRLIEQTRRLASHDLDPIRRSQLGQYLTPATIADFMASLFANWPSSIRLLDPGAGVGSLTEAFCERLLKCASAETAMSLDCYEIDADLTRYLRYHIDAIGNRLRAQGHRLSATIHEKDFISEAAFFATMGGQGFTHAILNPPYKKINSGSQHRKLLRAAGIETVNLYTAFLGLVIASMRDGGEIVAIVPRSFCNGTYFRPFRNFLLSRTALSHLHVFTSRTRAFQDDDVLQENIILRLVRNGIQSDVVVSDSNDQSFSDYRQRELPFSEIVKPGDVERYIHIPVLDLDGPAHLFSKTLQDLDLEVSTGPVVDFRVRDFWLAEPRRGSAPLLYTHHFRNGSFAWPKEHKKPNALRIVDETEKWLMPRGYYTLTKRFSSKEERRRLVAFVIEPDTLDYPLYGFENHLNVFHSRKTGLDVIPEISST